MKNTLQGINSEVDKAEDQIRDWDDKEAKNTQLAKPKEKRTLKNQDGIRSL